MFSNGGPFAVSNPSNEIVTPVKWTYPFAGSVMTSKWESHVKCLENVTNIDVISSF